MRIQAHAYSLPHAYPHEVAYVLNLKTANLINLELPQELIRGALQVFQ